MLYNSPPIVFNDTFVERVDKHRHLGVWLSSNLDFKKHIHETCLKANQKLAVLRSVKFLSRQTLDILYKLTVRSVIDYGLILYFNNLNVSDKGRLEQVQYRAAKLCSGALHFINREKLNTELGWESIENGAKF